MGKIKRYIKKVTAVLLAASMIANANMNANVLAAKSNSPKISMSKSNATLYIGGTTKLKVKGKKGKVNWKTSNKKVATVTKNGKVTGKKAGNAKITAQVKGSKKKASCKIKVGKYLSKLTLKSANSLILQAGEVSQISYAVAPKDAAIRDVSFQSLNPAVATVSKKGKIQAKAPGVTQIKLVSKGVNKAKKKLESVVTVTVFQSNADDKDVPDPTVIVTPPTETGSPEVSPAPSVQTIQERVDAIQPPTNDQVVADQFVVNDGGLLRTMYFLNKDYAGNVVFTINGKSFNKNISVETLLREMQNEYIVYTNSSSTVKIARSYSNADDWWTITDLTISRDYKMKSWLNDDMYKSPYGLIMTQGDTLGEIVFE